MQAPATIQTDKHPRLRHWEECKNALRKKIPSPFYHTFIQPIEALTPGNGHRRDGEGTDAPLLLSIPGEKLLKHIEARYYPIILGTLRDIQFQGQVSLISRKPDASTLPEAPADMEIGTDKDPAGSGQADEAVTERERAFIAHPANRSAAAKLRNLTYPGSLALMSGPSGAGKTMLAREIVEALNASRGPDEKPRAIYLSLETFLTEFSLACRTRETIEWRRALREHAFIVIDDFQFIKGTAKKSQEELRNLLDDFESRDHKLLLVSDIDFNRLPLQADLKSRLYPGYRVELRWPDTEGRTRILDRELNRLGLRAGDGTAEYLAGRITGDIRKITSAALRLRHDEDAWESGDFRPDNLDRILGDLYESPRETDPALVLAKVADFFGMDPAAVRGPAREKKYVQARHLTAYICVEHLKMKLTDTAALLGRKDHGSIIHARKKILELMEKDLFLKKQVREILASLRISPID